MSEEYRPAGFRLLPTVVKHLLIINAICYLAYYVLAQRGIINLNAICGIYGIQTGMFRPWQPLTYMFMHANFDHLFFNMFALWMFGSVLESHWGARRFLFYYLICGIGAGLLNMLVPGQYYSVGASGAVYGLLLAFGMTFPNVRIYILLWMLVIMALTSLLSLWASPLGALLSDWSLFIFMGIFLYSSMTGRGIVGIKAKWMVIIYVVLELFEGIFRSYDGIAHFAHLGGMLFGLLLILYWRKNPAGPNKNFRKLKDIFQSWKRRSKMKYTRYTEVKDEPRVPRSDEEYNYQKAQTERDIDAILDKVAKDGYSSLTPEEKEFLFKNSR